MRSAADVVTRVDLNAVLVQLPSSLEFASVAFPSSAATVGTVHAPSSSDTESENEPETDNKHRDSDSSDTESASGPEDTSTEMPPPEAKKTDVPLPPENLEPKQLKKLETMKESPA